MFGIDNRYRRKGLPLYICLNNMKKKLIIILTLIGINSFGQELSCADFKTGTFNTSISEPVQINWKIVRDGNVQTEIMPELPIELKDSGYPTDPQYGIINWIDDCTYRLTYDESKAELTESQKLINYLGGVLTELIKIEENCYYYKSTLKYEGGEQVTSGKLCK